MPSFDFTLVTLYFKRSIVLQFLLGIPSGLPLALTASTLTVWLSEAGISLAGIGIFALVALPYSFKFLWAPLLDGINIPRIGKRRGWILITQLAMMGAISLMALSNPTANPLLTALAAVLLSFCSASHDIAKDAYRVEILPAEEQGAGAAIFVLGYRIGMMISTAGALFLASSTSWENTYLLMAAALGVLLLPVFFMREPATHHNTKVTKHTVATWLSYYVTQPFMEFLKRKDAWLILAFIICYRMADAFIGFMTNPFYLSLGFTKPEIAEVVKLYGLVATIIGSIIGGAIVFRIGIYKALWAGGLLAALSNLMFVWQAYVGHQLYALASTVTLDNLSGGIATAAFVAIMSKLCNREFTATQYALLSSLAAVGRTWLSTPSGLAAETFGWEIFFIFSVVVALPGLLFLKILGKKLKFAQ